MHIKYGAEANRKADIKVHLLDFSCRLADCTDMIFFVLLTIPYIQSRINCNQIFNLVVIS